MMDWKTFGEDENQLEGESKLIVEKLGGVRKSFFRRVKRKGTKRTRLIYVALSCLGHDEVEGKLHYRVMSHSLPKWMTQEPEKMTQAGKCRGIFKNVEWLYDLHWYEENKSTHYMVTRMRLVVECEWKRTRREEKKGIDGKRDPYGAIKYDFQKLLVSNADLRLMIYSIANKKHVPKLDDYFEIAIENYWGLERNSKFLFIAFDEKAKTLHYAEYKRLAAG